MTNNSHKNESICWISHTPPEEFDIFMEDVANMITVYYIVHFTDMWGSMHHTMKR